MFQENLCHGAFRGGQLFFYYNSILAESCRPESALGYCQAPTAGWFDLSRDTGITTIRWRPFRRQTIEGNTKNA
jgi:hypothetical protein